MNLPSSKSLNLILVPVCTLLLLLLLHRGCNRCPEQSSPTLQLVHDTAYVKNLPVEIKVPVPNPKHIKPAVDSEALTIFADDSAYSPYAQGYKDATEAYLKVRHMCRDTVYYNDTITSPDNWRLILLESLTGNRLISRKPMMEDLRPVITTTITSIMPPPKERIRFYGGLEISVNGTYTDRWGIGLGEMLTIPKGYAIRYGYDLRNNAHTGGIYVLVRAKK